MSYLIISNELHMTAPRQIFRPYFLSLVDCSRLVILRPMKNWLWPYQEAWSWTLRGLVETLSSVPVATAHRLTHPAALKIRYHHKVAHAS